MQWLGLAVSTLPGLAAVAAVLFTWVTVGQTKEEIRLAEHGQITNRFNVAVQHLGSESLDVRLGGIYALQRIMQDSTRDHPTIVSVLSAYVREHAPDPKGAPADVSLRPPTDIQGAVSVLAGRNPEPDANALVDLQSSDLRGVRLNHPHLVGADLAYADLRFAVWPHANLSEARLVHASLISADLADSQLRGVNLSESTLSGTRLMRSDLRRADITGAELDDARLTGANLTRANLTRANLKGADLAGADLRGANLTDADLTHANLAGANLRGANRTRTKFTTEEDWSFPVPDAAESSAG
ncbi:pentapeptide repeat-containing protein [Streptomyces sp. NPDC058664]|uniref:pentapeptide repeat-containing protein n=1 Tax=unclassified Streptomyces TaxID=2593676 RepID=UPI00364F63B5